MKRGREGSEREREGESEGKIGRKGKIKGERGKGIEGEG